MLSLQALINHLSKMPQFKPYNACCRIKVVVVLHTSNENAGSRQAISIG